MSMSDMVTIFKERIVEHEKLLKQLQERISSTEALIRLKKSKIEESESQIRSVQKIRDMFKMEGAPDSVIMVLTTHESDLEIVAKSANSTIQKASLCIAEDMRESQDLEEEIQALKKVVERLGTL